MNEMTSGENVALQTAAATLSQVWGMVDWFVGVVIVEDHLEMTVTSLAKAEMSFVPRIWMGYRVELKKKAE